MALSGTKQFLPACAMNRATQLRGLRARCLTMDDVVSPVPRSLALALLLLAGCHSSTQVAANASAAAGKVNGNLASSRFLAPDNFVALEDAREGAALVPSEGMSWRWNAVSTTALFGPSATASAFSIECNA